MSEDLNWPDDTISRVTLPTIDLQSGVVPPVAEAPHAVEDTPMLHVQAEFGFWDKVNIVHWLISFYNQSKGFTMKDWKTTICGAFGGVLVAVGDLFTSQGGSITLKGVLGGAAVALLGWFSGDKKTTSQ